MRKVKRRKLKKWVIYFFIFVVALLVFGVLFKVGVFDFMKVDDKVTSKEKVDNSKLIETGKINAKASIYINEEG